MLLNLSANFGEQVPAGTRITLRLTNQERTNMIGTTRETVNRPLNRFWDERLIDMRTARVVVVESGKTPRDGALRPESSPRQYVRYTHGSKRTPCVKLSKHNIPT